MLMDQMTRADKQNKTATLMKDNITQPQTDVKEKFAIDCKNLKKHCLAHRTILSGTSDNTIRSTGQYYPVHRTTYKGLFLGVIFGRICKAVGSAGRN